MLEMGVVADIIVFHPYDTGHWGFDCMGGRNAGANYDTTHDNFYLKCATPALGDLVRTFAMPVFFFGCFFFGRDWFYPGIRGHVRGSRGFLEDR